MLNYVFSMSVVYSWLCEFLLCFCINHLIALTAKLVHAADTVHYIQLRIERRRAVKCLIMCSQCLWCIHDSVHFNFVFALATLLH